MINILPPKEKETLRNEENKKIILIIGILISVLLICLIFILTSIEIFISGRVEAERIINESEKEESEVSEIKYFSEKINLANKAFSDLNSFYKNQIKSVEVFSEISETIPEGIYITIFSYQKDISRISLSGFSSSRDSLLQFQRNLEQKEYFKDIYFPPSTWIKSENINFNLFFNIKK